MSGDHLTSAYTTKNNKVIGLLYLSSLLKHKDNIAWRLPAHSFKITIIDFLKQCMARLFKENQNVIDDGSIDQIDLDKKQIKLSLNREKI